MENNIEIKRKKKEKQYQNVGTDQRNDDAAPTNKYHIESTTKRINELTD